jgi:hypothetical protein
MGFTSTLGTDAREKFGPIARRRRFCVTRFLGSDCSCLLEVKVEVKCGSEVK